MSASSLRVERFQRLAMWAAIPVAILVAGLLVWQGSNAAFTAQTRNTGNSWQTGQVTLTDDDAGVAAFSVQDLVPGDTGSRCITVTSTSSVPGEVAFYLSRLGADGLENNIKMTAEMGSGGSFGNCEGFVPEHPATPADTIANDAANFHDWATGRPRWETAGTPGENRTYRFTWVFDTAGLTQAQVDELQGKSVSADVVWELRTK